MLCFCAAQLYPGMPVQVNSVDLLWNSILSSMTSGKTDEEDPGAGEDEGGEGQEELAFGSVDGTAISSAPAAAAAAKE